MARTATNPQTGERVQWNEATNAWEPMAPAVPAAPAAPEPPAPATPGVLPAMASGASRGVLSTLDIIPRGIAGGANLVRQLMSGQTSLPELWAGPPAEEAALNLSPFQRLGTAAGLGQVEPVTPGERRGAFTGEMMGATALPAGLAGRVAGLPGLAGEVISGLGATAGGLVSEEMGVGTTPGVLAGGLAPTAMASAARRSMLPRRIEEAPELVAAAQRQNVPISAGQAVGGSWLERVLETLPGGFGAKQGLVERQTERMRQRLDDITEGTIEPEVMAAGAQITQGIDDWATRFRGAAGELYGAAEEVVPMQTAMEPSKLRRAVDQLHGRGAFAGITDNPLTTRIATALDELPEGRASYQDLRELRSMIGRQLSTPSIVADAPRAELKQLYRAITDDMQDTVRQVGGEDAIRAWRAADAHWKRGMERIDKILEPIQRRKTPEEVFNAAVSGTKQGSTKIKALRDSLTPDQWDIVRRTVMRQLGEATPGAQTLESATATATDFNPERFLTNMAKIRPEARNILFEGQPDLDDLTKVASGMQQAASFMRQPSQTTRMAAQMIAPLGAVSAFYDPALAIGAGGLVGSAYGAQRFLQSPLGVQWATQPTPMVQRGLFGAVPRLEAAQ